MKFIKNDKQFIPFDKIIQPEYKFLLEKPVIEVEYLYKNKRDEVQRKIEIFKNEV